jgi:lipopolysaccharide transport protein LptA
MLVALMVWFAAAPLIGVAQEQINSGTAVHPARSSKHVKAVNADATKVDDAKPASNSPFGAFENNSNRGPVNIQSDSLALDYKNNAVLFSGKVHAMQADGQLMSNTLNVKYGKDFHVVQQMVADGDVQVRQGLRWCSADHMVMDEAAHTAVLTGSPICHDANDQISGTKITVHTDSGTSEVEGGVKALIFPHEEKTRDNRATSQKN